MVTSQPQAPHPKPAAPARPAAPAAPAPVVVQGDDELSDVVAEAERALEARAGDGAGRVLLRPLGGENVATLRIQLGRDSGISVRTLRKFVCKAGRIAKTLIGDITMNVDASEVAVPRDVAVLIARMGTIEVKEHRPAVSIID